VPWPSLGRVLCCLALALAAGRALCEEPATPEQRPPTYPDTKRVFSATPSSCEIKILKYLFLRGKGLKRIVSYVASTPGTAKVQIFKHRAKPTPGPAEVHAFYTDWAEKAGYRLIVEVRMGRPPRDWRIDDTDRPYKEKPKPPRPPWEEEEYIWVDAFHRPGVDGGVFISVWTEFQHIWVWKPGHCPVAPILGEWLGLPRVKADMTPPTEVLPFPEPLDFPPLADDSYYIRTQVGKWEIDSLSRDLQARSALGKDKTALEILFSVAPTAFAPVQHMWLTTFRDLPAEREASVAPWADWATRRGWARIPITGTAEANVRAWYGTGPKAGAMVVFDVKETSNVMVFDGAPNLLALMPMMTSFERKPVPAPRPERADEAHEAPTRPAESAGHVGTVLSR
jgi:hypothetical protein